MQPATGYLLNNGKDKADYQFPSGQLFVREGPSGLLPFNLFNYTLNSSTILDTLF